MNRSKYLLAKVTKCKCGKRIPDKCNPNAIWQRYNWQSGIDQWQSGSSMPIPDYFVGPSCEVPKDEKWIDSGSMCTRATFWKRIPQSLVDFIIANGDRKKSSKFQ